jgi:hypothetical protein
MASSEPAPRDPSARCADCGALAPRAYCPECGQKTALHAASVREVIHELVGQFIAVEGKLWRTLALLAFQPGRLTTEYLAGRRNRYIVPLRLYLSASFLFFLIVKVAMPAAPPGSLGFDPQHSVIATDDGGKVTREGAHLTIESGDANESPVEVDLDPDLRCGDKDAPCATWKKALARTLAAYKADPGRERARFVDRLQSNASYALFAMLPVFALLTSLVYRNRRMYYGEHMVFALHMHTFWFLAALLLTFLPGDIGDPLWLLVFGYGLWAMHRVYRGRWFPTVLRAVFISSVYSVVVGLVTIPLMVYLFLT